MSLLSALKIDFDVPYQGSNILKISKINLIIFFRLKWEDIQSMLDEMNERDKILREVRLPGKHHIDIIKFPSAC